MSITFHGPNLRVIRDNTGHPQMVHINAGTEAEPVWASLPFLPESASNLPNEDRFNAVTDQELELLILAHMLEAWSELDLSDHEVEAVTPDPDYLALEELLREKPILARLFSTNASNILIIVVDALRNKDIAKDKRLADFSFYLPIVIANIVPPLTTEEVEELNNYLAIAHFPIQVGVS